MPAQAVVEMPEFTDSCAQVDQPQRGGVALRGARGSSVA
jgi:hypothetical protein